MKTNELPPEVVAALREYIMFRSSVLMFQDELHILKDKNQRCIDPSAIKESYELVAQKEIRLGYMINLQEQARENFYQLISANRISSEDIVKALS